MFIYIEPLRCEKNKIQRLEIETQLSRAEAMMLLRDQVVVVVNHHRHRQQLGLKTRHQNGSNRQVLNNY